MEEITIEEKLSLVQQIWELSETEEEKLEEFKELCRHRALYFAAGEDERTEPTHDDATLLRFLRARKWDLNAALTMFENTENWRKCNRVDDLFDSFDVAEFEETRKYYPAWTGHRDRNGIPLYCYSVGSLDTKKMAAFYKSANQTPDSPLPSRLQRLVVVGEHVENYVNPICSSIPHRPNPERPIETTTNIVDITGVGISQFWSLKSHLQAASELVTSHYPESLERVFVIGAPSSFARIWSFAKNWFDPATTKKIFILSAAETESTLLQYVKPEDLPKKYGGTLDWEFGQPPKLDDEVQAALDLSMDGESKLPIGPARWKDGRTFLVGRVDGKSRMK